MSECRSRRVHRRMFERTNRLVMRHPLRHLVGTAYDGEERIKTVPFTVIGTLAPKGQSPTGQDQDDVGQRIAAPLIGKGAMHELLHILLSRSERPHKHFRGAQPGSAQAAKRPGYR
jgi:hypothetical protein